MKKLISLCLVLTLVVCLSIPAFAADHTNVGTGSYSTTVTGSTVNGTTGGTVFMVDISWTGMNFTYHGVKEPTWDAENHTYTDRVAAWWEGQGSISIINDSNTRIYAAPTYEAAAGYEDADMVFSTDKLHVASAEYGTQQSGTITVTPTGSLPNDTQNKTIGTITVTIAEDPDVTVEEAQMLNAAIQKLYKDFCNSEFSDRSSEKYNDKLNNDMAELATCGNTLVNFSETQEDRNRQYSSAYPLYISLLATYNALLGA